MRAHQLGENLIKALADLVIADIRARHGVYTTPQRADLVPLNEAAQAVERAPNTIRHWIRTGRLTSARTKGVTQVSLHDTREVAAQINGGGS